MSDGSFALSQAPVRVVAAELPEVAAQPPKVTPLPVEKPPVAAKDLFLTMERLDHGMNAALLGSGTYPGKVLLDRVFDTRFWWGGAMGLGTGVYLAMHVGSRGGDAAFFVGGAAGVLAAVGLRFGLEWVNQQLHKLPVSVKAATPFLDAFKRGDASTQKAVVTRAGKWADEINTHVVMGKDLRQQLRELGKVDVKIGSTADSRVRRIEELVGSLPKKKTDNVPVASITYALQQLEPEDRQQVAALLLERLYDGEKLRGASNAGDEETLYAALISTQPSRIATKDALQKLVATDA